MSCSVSKDWIGFRCLWIDYVLALSVVNYALFFVVFFYLTLASWSAFINVFFFCLYIVIVMINEMVVNMEILEVFTI